MTALPQIKNEPNLIKFLLCHLLFGTVGGVTFGLGALYLDIGGIHTLAMSSEHTGMTLFLFFFGLFVTFGSLGMALGIMSLGRDSDDNS